MSSQRAQKAKQRAQRQAKRQERRARHAAVAAKKEAQRQLQLARTVRVDAAAKAPEPSTKPQPSKARRSSSKPATTKDPARTPVAATTPPSPATDSEPCATLIAPAYLVEAETSCWNCLRDTAVFALAAEGIESLISSSHKSDKFELMSPITWLSADLQQFLTRYSDSNYFLDKSFLDGSLNYMNHCSHCGAPLDDYALCCEPGAAFFPMDQEECQRITLMRLPDEIDLRISGQSWFTTFDWQTYARHR